MKKILSIVVFAVLLLSILTPLGVLNVSASNVKGDIKEARKRAEEELLPLEGVAGISHNEETSRIIVYIEHEKYRGKIPDEIKGFKTEVKVIGKIKALSTLSMVEPESIVIPLYTYTEPVSRTSKVRPIAGGISCGVPEKDYGGKMAGTLGIVTLDPYILSCAHVIAMNKDAEFLKIGTPVLQPGTYDGGTDSDKVGELYKYIKITFGGKSIKSPNYADAAIAKLTTSEYLKSELLDSDNQNTYTVSGIVEVSKGDTVRKSGRTSEVTKNSVTDTSATVKVWYTSTKWAIFKDQILVDQPFAKSGDSGSVVDKDNAFVGLVFAGSEDIVVVCKAKYIVEGLGITV